MAEIYRIGLTRSLLLAGLMTLFVSISFMAPAAQSAEASGLPMLAAGSAASTPSVDLGFSAVFPKPFYQKSYFPLALLLASIVIAGVISYVTAGAGAPTAATGVSTVATAVGGGGAGSYMAGLSTIGGLVGGNAMVGAAMLNGVSIAVGGAGAAWASLSAFGKVVVMLSLTATALDGVLFVFDPETKEAQYHISLVVPDEVGSREVKKLSKALFDVHMDILAVAQEVQPSPCSDPKLQACARTEKKRYDRDLSELERLTKRYETGTAKALEAASLAIKPGNTSEDRLVLAAISKNAGRSDLAKRLIDQIPANSLIDRGYLDYFDAVLRIECGKLDEAAYLLNRSIRSNPYAIEPVILLVNLLASLDFTAHQAEILSLVAQAEDNFDNDKYLTPYSMLAVNYRLGTLYLGHKNYPAALKFLEAAEDDVPWTQKHFGQKEIRKMVGIGIARARLENGDESGAVEKLTEVFQLAADDDELDRLKKVFLGAGQTAVTNP